MARPLAAGAVVFLMLLAVCSSHARASPASRKQLRSIDCRRLVFHPQCRGVAAKRSMPSVLDESRYPLDIGREATDPAPAPAPAAAHSLAALSADPLIRDLLGRLAVDSGRRGGLGDSDADASWGSVTDQSSAKVGELGRFDWPQASARKRMKEQEVTYDY